MSKFVTVSNLSEFLAKCKILFAKSEDLATVATSGSYNDLGDKPHIPEDVIIDTALSSTSNNPAANSIITAAINTKADKGTTLAAYGITDAKIANGVITLGNATITPLTSHQSLTEYAKLTDLEPYAKSKDLATVATSGSYNDLKDTPDEYVLPTATATTLGGIKIGTDLTIADGVVNVNHATNADLATKATKDGEGNIIVDTYATKTDIAALAKALKYKGSVANYAALPTDAEIGDVWNVQAADKTHGVKAGENVVWNGTDWDNLGGTCDMSEYTKTEDLAAVATSGDYNDLLNIPDAYTLPTASTSTLGGVKIGSDLSIAADGVLSVTHATKADSATTAASATKATQDGSGNVISTTYAKAADIQEATTAEIEALFN